MGEFCDTASINSTFCRKIGYCVFPLKARAFSSELKNASLWVNSKVQPASDCVTTYVCHLHNRKILFLKPANSKKRASNSVLVQYNHGIVWDFEGWIDTILKGKRISVTNCLNAQCGKFRIFLSLRFYVKSILENLEVLKLPFCCFKSSEICWFCRFQPSKSAKNHKHQNSEPQRCVWMAHFESLDSPTLIPRKIWVTEKFCNFHTEWKYNIFPATQILRESKVENTEKDARSTWYKNCLVVP